MNSAELEKRLHFLNGKSIKLFTLIQTMRQTKEALHCIGALDNQYCRHANLPLNHVELAGL